MKERKYHFGVFYALYPTQMNTICGVWCPSSPIERYERPAIKDRCKRCIVGMKGIRVDKIMGGDGFWFRRIEI